MAPSAAACTLPMHNMNRPITMRPTICQLMRRALRSASTATPPALFVTLGSIGLTLVVVVGRAGARQATLPLLHVADLEALVALPLLARPVELLRGTGRDHHGGQDQHHKTSNAHAALPRIERRGETLLHFA